jgi:hypothetical protein
MYAGSLVAEGGRSLIFLIEVCNLGTSQEIWGYIFKIGHVTLLLTKRKLFVDVHWPHKFTGCNLLIVMFMSVRGTLGREGATYFGLEYVETAQ